MKVMQRSQVKRFAYLHEVPVIPQNDLKMMKQRAELGASAQEGIEIR